jgi:hypothetical protein
MQLDPELPAELWNLIFEYLNFIELAIMYEIFSMHSSSRYRTVQYFIDALGMKQLADSLYRWKPQAILSMVRGRDWKRFYNAIIDHYRINGVESQQYPVAACPRSNARSTAILNKTLLNLEVEKQIHTSRKGELLQYGLLRSRSPGHLDGPPTEIEGFEFLLGDNFDETLHFFCERTRFGETNMECFDHHTFLTIWRKFRIKAACYQHKSEYQIAIPIHWLDCLGRTVLLSSEFKLFVPYPTELPAVGGERRGDFNWRLDKMLCILEVVGKYVPRRGKAIIDEGRLNREKAGNWSDWWTQTFKEISL